jgi:hypothetical protein
MTLKSTIELNVSSRLSASGDLSADSVKDLERTYSAILRNGTGLGQAARLYSDAGNILGGANADLDLAGTLADGIGGTAVFANIKGLVVRALASNANNITLGAAAANPWTALLGATGTVVLKPDTTFCVFVGPTSAGYPVVATTGDILRLANGPTNAVDYEIIIIGT